MILERILQSIGNDVFFLRKVPEEMIAMMKRELRRLRVYCLEESSGIIVSNSRVRLYVEDIIVHRAVT